jgi:hypothetical protein
VSIVRTDACIQADTSSSSVPFASLPNPTNATNRCRLKPLKPETPEITLLLVCPQRRLALQAVCCSRPRFQLPNPSSQTRLPTQTQVTSARTRLGDAPGTHLGLGVRATGAG